MSQRTLLLLSQDNAHYERLLKAAHLAAQARQLVFACEAESAYDAIDFLAHECADLVRREPRRDLLDMRRLAGAVIALHHYPPVEGEPGEDRQRGFRIKHVAFVEVGYARIRLAEGGNRPVDIDPEDAAHIDSGVGRGEYGLVGRGLGGVSHVVHRGRSDLSSGAGRLPNKKTGAPGIDAPRAGVWLYRS